ncbi:hypothetical protein C0993_009928 [Termitomyces sp. T159_Od127]|nr:hypothetical protein C0993_009928 [Termitomyces sp. T159_Od127]
MTKRLLAWLEAAGQPMPVATLFLQDNLAVVVIEELLNQIKLMKRQCMSVLEQIDCASKRKVGGYDEPTTEPKRARLQVQPPHPVVEVVRPKAPVAAQPAHSEPAAARLPPVKPPVARKKITFLAQQIDDLQSTAKNNLVQCLAPIMAHLGLYHKAMDSYNAVFKDHPIIFQHGQQLDPIPLDWVDHAYTYGMVYLEQQFHQPMMSLDIFQEINDKCKQRLITYSTSPAILQWDGWHEIIKEDHYRLMFKREEECYQPDYTPLKVRDLYYHIGMDSNWVNLWKQMSAHNVSEPSAPMTNIALGDEAMMTELGKV